MKLRRLAIGQLPGIDGAFALEDIGDGIQVIVGPNGIGKSSLIRAMRAVLWSDRSAEGHVAASALFEGDDERWSVERDGTRHRWQRAGVYSDPPPLPAAHLDGCFFLVLRDLLDASDDRGADLARLIRQQMSGGFDIDKVAGALFATVGPRYGRTERRDFDAAEQALRQAAARQGALSRQEEQLSSLDDEIAQADMALGRLESHDNAIELLRYREKLEQVNAALAALPGALAHLTGDELQVLEQREAEIAENHRRRTQAEADLETAEKDAAETRLEEALVPAALAAWRDRAGALGTLEVQLERATAELAARRGECAAAAQAAGGREEEALAIDLAGAGDVFGFLREATSVATENQAIAEQLEILKGVIHPRESQQRLELLREGIGPLRAWLRAPDPALAGATAGQGKRSLLLWSGVVLAGVGAALALLIQPLFALLLTAGLGIALGAWILRPAPATGDRREAAERDFPHHLAPPDQWAEDAVGALLREMEREAAELEASAKRADYADADRSRLETRRAVLDTRMAELDRRRRALAGALNLEAIPPDAELVDTARALDRLRQDVQAERGAAEVEKTLAEQYRSALAALSAELTARGEPAPTDAASSRAAVDSLAERDSRLLDARHRERGARRALDQIDRDVARIDQIIAAVYKGADIEPGDRAGLQGLLGELDEFKALREKRDELEMRIRLAREKLETAGELDLTRRTPAQLAEDRQRMETQASRRGDLQDQRAKILVDVDNAREGHDLEDAIAARESSRARLAESRDKALHAAAGRFLLDAVKREHETNQMPRVLERARELFSRFTHHAYELRVVPDKAGSFVAVEAGTGAGKRPDQLSDGTRAQLLLAARLAFAEQAEHGESLPLFLDEALDHSDPVRFRAIAGSLAHMATDAGRQIFYLTNDPTDVQRIQNALTEEACPAAGVIDLLDVRKRASAVPGAESLRVEDLPEVPDPTGMTLESYGAALGVAPFDPRRGHAAQHLLHLLWDDLALLHRLLASRIESVGQWQNLSRMGAHLAREIGTGFGAGAELDARARLLEAFCAARLEGRGRLVDRAAIEDSTVVGEHYLHDVAEIAVELDGDAVRLVQTLRERGDERLRGFRARITDALERYLIDKTYIDPRPILTASDINARLLAVPAAGELPERTVTECIHRWWRLAERTDSGSGHRSQVDESLSSSAAP